MIRYITLGEALEVHARIMAQSGGIATLLSIGALESALAQPRMTFGGEELYPTVLRKRLLWASRSSRTTLSWMEINGQAMR